MEFRIADTFTDSLAKLTGEEQKNVKTTAFDLQMSPVNTGMQLHKLERAKDKNFWSVRVGSDIRLIEHKTESSILLCYVDHHDKAYAWAVRRKLETHPKTGAAQLVEIRETVQEITIPKYIEVEQPRPPKPLLFARLSEDQLLSYGVPPEWLNWEEYRDVRRLGRKTRLPEPQRALLWAIFDLVRSQLNERGLITYAGLFSRLSDQLKESKKSPFDFAVVDEAQDVGIPQLRFLAALAADQPNGLFFAGDLGQRIFQQPFSWKALGVDIPSQARFESVADEADLEEVYNTERHLLYVACTRARDSLLVTSVEPASEFLDDLRM